MLIGAIHHLFQKDLHLIKECFVEHQETLKIHNLNHNSALVKNLRDMYIICNYLICNRDRNWARDIMSDFHSKSLVYLG